LRDGAPSVHEAAVLDVGSNSVRLVAYRVDGRAMTPFLNEKVMAGLGRGLRETGSLSPRGVEEAMAAMRRFRTMLDALGVSDIEAVATAAVRDAKDGPAFAKRLASETGIKLRILSGGDEARLSALGVLAAEPEAHGIVGDLGGSSLELVEVGAQGPGRGETHSLGPLALMNGVFDAKRVSAQVDEALQASQVLTGKGGAFYAVGGAWRALGRIDIAIRQHPIGVLHHHEMSRADVLRVVDFVRTQSKKSLEKFEEAAAKRAEALPYASVVMERLLRWGGFERVILSAFGLREGVLFEKMSDAARAVHPLIASAEAFGAPTVRARAFGAALEKFIAPAMAAAPNAFGATRDALLRAAACRLADLGAGLHPDQRAEIVFDLVLRAPLAGISHHERAFLAGAMRFRYTKAPPKEREAFDRLLTDDQRRAAAALGAAMRLGADLSGRADHVLAAFTLKLSGGVLSLSVKPSLRHLLTDQAARRFEPLANLLGVGATLQP
jgi:exopolyphosphatase/guanosine-5'-triphosphate,3'-diphosphate pyrophosphatase